MISILKESLVIHLYLLLRPINWRRHESTTPAWVLIYHIKSSRILTLMASLKSRRCVFHRFLLLYMCHIALILFLHLDSSITLQGVIEKRTLVVNETSSKGPTSRPAIFLSFTSCELSWVTRNVTLIWLDLAHKTLIALVAALLLHTETAPNWLGFVSIHHLETFALLLRERVITIKLLLLLIHKTTTTLKWLLTKWILAVGLTGELLVVLWLLCPIYLTETLILKVLTFFLLHTSLVKAHIWLLRWLLKLSFLLLKATALETTWVLCWLSKVPKAVVLIGWLTKVARTLTKSPWVSKTQIGRSFLK